VPPASGGAAISKERQGGKGRVERGRPTTLEPHALDLNVRRDSLIDEPRPLVFVNQMMRALLALVAVAPATALVVGVGSAMPPRPLPARAVTPTMDFFGDLKKGAAKLMAGDYDEAAVRAEIENNIARKPCIMYATSTCPFCLQAREVLDGLGTMYTVVDLDEEDNGMAIKVCDQCVISV